MAVGAVPGQDDYQPVVAQRLHGLEGDAVHDAAVQIQPVSNRYRPGNKGQRRRGPQCVHLLKHVFDQGIFRMAGLDVGHHSVKGYPRGLKALLIKGIQLRGHRAVGKVRAEQIAGP